MNTETKKTMKKTLLIVLVAFVACALLLLTPYIYILIRNSTYEKTDSIDDFLNKNYVQYNGGEDAQEFFDSFADLEGNTAMSFKYRDNDRRIMFRSGYHTVFVLDVTYSDEKYRSHKDSIWEDTDMPDANEASNYKGSFLLTTVMLDEAFYKYNYCGVFFNDTDNTIRYIFFYDVARVNAKDSIEEMIRFSVSLDWGED